MRIGIYGEGKPKGRKGKGKKRKKHNNGIIAQTDPKEDISEGSEIKINGDTYVLVRETIEPGDMYWMPFTGNVEKMKRKDYGPFNPNSMKSLKLKEIES